MITRFKHRVEHTRSVSFFQFIDLLFEIDIDVAQFLDLVVFIEKFLEFVLLLKRQNLGVKLPVVDAICLVPKFLLYHKRELFDSFVYNRYDECFIGLVVFNELFL